MKKFRRTTVLATAFALVALASDLPAYADVVNSTVSGGTLSVTTAGVTFSAVTLNGRPGGARLRGPATRAPGAQRPRHPAPGRALVYLAWRLGRFVRRARAALRAVAAHAS